MVLKGEKIILVPYTIERCHEFFKEYVADSAMTYDAYTYDKENVDRYFQNRTLDSSRMIFAICHNNNTVGEIQIKQIDLEKLCCTLSVHLVNDSVKGKGYGTEAQRLLIDYAINKLGLKTIYADVIHRNHRSKHVLEKLGFEHLYDDDALAYYSFSVK
ncbi:GNAT family N-acetyltransferase [Clostridium sp.]|uniref:GNAT family N-acetyltransferase n=1 Tax=Clostridium sp. TaxID=1506 RepID=UPI0025895D21|nr:GNAT family N-acetyltransferase [Clostridium sp.]MDF2504564.1 GCN5-related N-acetyltransferase [Clostridium sp.]